MFETFTNTAICFSDRSLVNQVINLPTMAESAVSRLRQLVEIVAELSQLSAFPDVSFCPEHLSAYIAEEVQDVLDALLVASPAGVTLPEASALGATSTILLESLIPAILWAVARSSFQVMQLIEGVEAAACLPGQLSQRGILRLIVQLELETPDWKRGFDLATGRSPRSPMPSHLILQTEPAVLLHPVSAFDQIQDPQSSTWQRQLLSLCQQIQHSTPALKSWLQGVPVKFLQPHSNWQEGRLTLKLDFEFLECLAAKELDGLQCSVQSVEAEILDDGEAISSHLASAIAPFNSTPGPLLELVDAPTLTSAIVQIAAPEIQAKYAALALHPELLYRLHHCQQLAYTDSKTATAAIVQAAWDLSKLTTTALSRSFSLLQPEFLLDELVPKLLWQVTRNSYEVVQLVGGVPANLLFPESTWDSGILRLMPILSLATETEEAWIDLTTSSFLTDPGWQLPTLAIAQSTSISICQQPIQLGVLLNHIRQTISETTPELALLLQGIAIECLSPEQDWQPGTLQLCLGLEFVSNIF